VQPSTPGRFRRVASHAPITGRQPSHTRQKMPGAATNMNDSIVRIAVAKTMGKPPRQLNRRSSPNR
jgi:hypothetical protein